jgi:hypothetical protein
MISHPSIGCESWKQKHTIPVRATARRGSGRSLEVELEFLVRLPEAALVVEAALLLEELAEGVASVVGKGVAAVAAVALVGTVVRVVAVVEASLELWACVTRESSEVDRRG